MHREAGRTKKLWTPRQLLYLLVLHAVALTLVAVVSSLLGYVLRFTLSQSTSASSATQVSQLTPQAFSLEQLLTLLTSATWIGSAILAFVFFNVYEFTDVGRNFRMGLGWRSALLIGALCGLMGDRILVALKAFLGA